MGKNNIEEIQFEKALDESEERTLLLGNGFSQSIWPEFGYKHLYDKSLSQSEEWVLNPSEDIKMLFKRLDTIDFEKILAYLNIAITVSSCYSSQNEFMVCLLHDKETLITSFIPALTQVHPKYRTDIDKYIHKTMSNVPQIYQTYIYGLTKT